MTSAKGSALTRNVLMRQEDRARAGTRALPQVPVVGRSVLSAFFLEDLLLGRGEAG